MYKVIFIFKNGAELHSVTLRDVEYNRVVNALTNYKEVRFCDTDLFEYTIPSDNIAYVKAIYWKE